LELGAPVLGDTAPPPALICADRNHRDQRPWRPASHCSQRCAVPFRGALASETPLASEALDSGDTNAFSSLEAGAIACGRDLHPHEQGQIVASRW